MKESEINQKSTLGSLSCTPAVLKQYNLAIKILDVDLTMLLSNSILSQTPYEGRLYWLTLEESIYNSQLKNKE